MAKFKNKESGAEVSAMTWEEFIEHGKANTNPSNIHNGFPWSFKIGEYAVTHENDSRYLVQKPNGSGYPFSDFTPKDVLIIGTFGDLTPQNADVFNEQHEPVN